MGVYSYDGTNLAPIPGTNDEPILAPVEASTTSAGEYEIGDQFILSHVLYKATAKIEVGDTLTVGTNIEESPKIVPQIQTLTNNVSANATAIAKCETLVVSVASFSALPQTITNANIEDDMVVVNSVLSNPSAQTGDWTVTTSSGSLTISGSISGTTTATLYLMKSR